MKTIQGYDYRTGTELEKSKVEWREFLALSARQGCRRRVEGKETFIHDSRSARILVEIYAVIPPPKPDNVNAGEG